MRFSLLAMLLTVGAVASSAQNAGPQVVIRTESRLVLVDAVVTDNDGKPVRGLSAKDFRVWEDNKEQTITSFGREAAALSPARAQKRYFVFLFDNSTLPPSAEVSVRQQVVSFVDAYASPDRYMAVVNFHNSLTVAQNFTVIADPLKRASGTALGAGSLETVSTSRPDPAPARGGFGSTIPPVGIYSFRSFLSSIKSLAASLATVRGRKALILLSGGFPLVPDLQDEFQAAIDACNMANVVIYAVDARGLGLTYSPSTSVPIPSAGASGVPSRVEREYDNQEPLVALARGTGGLFVKNTNQVMEALGMIAQEQDESYILGYVPPQMPEGSCHALRVRVNGSGLTLRARNAYCSARPAGLLEGTPAAKEMEARAAGASAGNISASMQIPYFYSAPNVARVHLAMEILPTGMKFQKQGGKIHSEMNVLGRAYNSGGSVAARFSDIVKLEFESQKEADAFLSQPFHYENQFEIAPGNYRVAVALGWGSESFGKLEAPLVIESYASTALAVSGLALGKEVRPAADLTSSLDGSLLTGPVRLVASGRQLTPYGANRFNRTERCLVYVEVYEPLLSTASPPTVGIRFRVIDRKTGEQKVDSGTFSVSDRVRTGNPVVPLILVAPVANLAPGSYQVEVRAVNSAGGTSSIRTANFEVN